MTQQIALSNIGAGIVAGGVLENAGVPSNGTTAVQTVTVTGSPAGGTFTLVYKGLESAAIAYNASAASLQTILRAHPAINAADVNVSGSDGGPYTITFAGNLVKLAVGAFSLGTNALTGGTAPSITVDQTTPGVTATNRGAAPGALLVDTTNHTLYQNQGTALAPTWSILGAGFTVGNATATDVAEARTGFAYFNGPAAASTTNIVSTVNLTNVALTIAAQPDVPRKLTITVVDTTPSIVAGSVAIVGVDASGNAASESISIAAGAGTYISTKAYASITSITVSGASVLGGSGDETIAVGGGTALGLPGCKTPAPSAFAVHKANLDKVGEAVGTVDATAGTIIPTTAPNGTRTYSFWYTYAVTPTQNAHTHTTT